MNTIDLSDQQVRNAAAFGADLINSDRLTLTGREALSGNCGVLFQVLSAIASGQASVVNTLPPEVVPSKEPEGDPDEPEVGTAELTPIPGGKES